MAPRKKTPKEPKQDPLQRLVDLIVDAFKGGIEEYRKSQTKSPTKSKEAEGEVSQKEGGWVQCSQKVIEPDTEGDSSGSSRNFKRKWSEIKYKEGGESSKKNKVKACTNCGKNHVGVCLKGKRVCYRCGQKGHISPNCSNARMDQKCFACGSPDHRIKDCPKKKRTGGKTDPTYHKSTDEEREHRGKLD